MASAQKNPYEFCLRDLVDSIPEIIGAFIIDINGNLIHSVTQKILREKLRGFHFPRQ